MIVVKLMGGLGNQMFQYAAGRCASCRTGTELKLDLSWFEQKEANRTYGLSVFNIEGQVANSPDYRRFKLTGLSARINRLLRSLYQSKASLVLRDYSLTFNNLVTTWNGSLYLDGYWQSEKYFSGFENVVREDFKVRTEPGDMNRQMMNRMRSEESVSVHFRRGDYNSDPMVNKLHGVLPLSYYSMAVEAIASRVSNPVFYVFSDDQAWVRMHFKIDYPVVYVDQNDDEKNFEDLRLMSFCKNNIIANSSFSWWGAWLNPRPEKIVIAPKSWFFDGSKNSTVTDLVPNSWIRL